MNTGIYICVMFKPIDLPVLNKLEIFDVGKQRQDIINYIFYSKMHVKMHDSVHSLSNYCIEKFYTFLLKICYGKIPLFRPFEIKTTSIFTSVFVSSEWYFSMVSYSILITYKI